MTKQEIWAEEKADCDRFILNKRQAADLEVAERAFNDFGKSRADAHWLTEWATACGCYIQLGEICRKLSEV